jgi:hypothetical protein
MQKAPLTKGRLDVPFEKGKEKGTWGGLLCGECLPFLQEL